jgi:hypothetical protein
MPNSSIRYGTVTATGALNPNTRKPAVGILSHANAETSWILAFRPGLTTDLLSEPFEK